MLLRTALLLGVLLPLAWSNSSGTPSICTVSSNFGCNSWVDGDRLQCNDPTAGVMDWARKPVRSDAFRVTAVGGETSYTPGEILEIQVRVFDFGMEYRGLLLHAVDSSGDVVGHWDVPEDDIRHFHVPSQCPQAVLHTNAEIKPILSIHRFVAPPAGTGTVTIMALFKVGPANEGEFYYSQRDPTFTEGPVQEQVWYEARSGETCSAACAREGKSVDTAAFTAASGKSGFMDTIAPHKACRLPILEGCSANAPMLETDFCYYYPTRSCSEAQTPGADPPDRQTKFCACAGAPSPTCSDGIRNQGETGTDCGGPCPACPPPPATCNDGIQNQGEVGVDCGGPCSECTSSGGYTIVGPNMNCGGTEIRTWSDGSDANYGPNTHGAGNCELICNAHVECLGFVFVDSNSACGYWQGGTLSPSPQAGRKCYRKGGDGGGANPPASNPVFVPPPGPVEELTRFEAYSANAENLCVDMGGGGGADPACGGASNCAVGSFRAGNTYSAVINKRYIVRVIGCSENGNSELARVEYTIGTPPSCIDGVANGDETDVDCGGSCGACLEGFACSSFLDCASSLCVDSVCRRPCSDGVMNGDETGVDCGGSCGRTCVVGVACGDDSDCASGVCTASVCTRETTCTPLTPSEACSPLGLSCGDIGDGCGGTVSCGTCETGEICGGSGVSGACGLVGECDDSRLMAVEFTVDLNIPPSDFQTAALQDDLAIVLEIPVEAITKTTLLLDQSTDTTSRVVFEISNVVISGCSRVDVVRAALDLKALVSGEAAVEEVGRFETTSLASMEIVAVGEASNAEEAPEEVSEESSEGEGVGLPVILGISGGALCVVCMLAAGVAFFVKNRGGVSASEAATNMDKFRF